MTLTVIVPCYNEEQVLSITHERLLAMIDGAPWDGRILYIDDGSSDTTAIILDELKSDSRVSVIHFSRNFGHQAAVSAGLHRCSGDMAAIIDADLQDPPELIPLMVEKLQDESADIVYGKRRSRVGEGWFKKQTSKLYYRLLNTLSDVPVPLDTGDFRVLNRAVIEAYRSLPERNKYIRGLFAWMGFVQVPYLYDRDARAAGETKYPLVKMLRLAADGLVSLSRKPLAVSLRIGLFTLLLSLALAVYVFISYFSNRVEVIPGWASTMLIIIFFSGVQLLTIGILGVYLGRLYDEVKGRPEYIIRDEEVDK